MQNKRVVVGALHKWFYDWVIDWFDYHTWSIHSALWHAWDYSFNCVLTLFLDSALINWCQGMPRSHFDRSLLSVLILPCAWSLWVSVDFPIDCHDNFILLVETRL